MKIKKIENVINYLKNHTWKETAEHFKISEMTITRYIKRYELTNRINNTNYIMILKRGFNKLIKQDIYDMKANELRIIYYLLTNKSISMSKMSYIKKIINLTGVK